MASWFDSLTPDQIRSMSPGMRMFFLSQMGGSGNSGAFKVFNAFKPVDAAVNTAVQAVSNAIAPISPALAGAVQSLAINSTTELNKQALAQESQAQAQARRAAEIAQHQATSQSISASGSPSSPAANAAKVNESIRYVETADELEARRKQALLSGGSSINLGQLGKRGAGGSPRTSLLG